MDDGADMAQRLVAEGSCGGAAEERGEGIAFALIASCPSILGSWDYLCR